MEKALRETFIPILFGQLGMVMNNDNRRLYSQGVKQGGLNIHNPCEGAEGLHASSKVVMAELVKALVKGMQLGLGAHADAVKDVREAAKAATVEKENAFLEAYGAARSAKVRKRMQRAKYMGGWLTRMPSRIEGTQTTYDE